MRHLKILFGIFAALAASRLIPHPPNFTSLIALSFYIPAVFGRKYIAAVILSFFITDLIIGFHALTFFTWGSVLIIGLLAKYFLNNISTRILGPLIGALIFFIISNFGVWTQGNYGYSWEGFITCYIMAIPFFHYTVISTIIFSIIIEVACSLSALRVFKENKK